MTTSPTRAAGCTCIPFWYGPDFFPDQRANPGSVSKFIVGEDVGIFPIAARRPGPEPGARLR